MDDAETIDHRVPDPPDLVRFNEVSKITLGPNDVLLVKIPMPDGMPPRVMADYFKKCQETVRSAFAQVGRPNVPILVTTTATVVNIIDAVGRLDELPPCHIPPGKTPVEFEPRLCEREECRLPLPSGWVAVYCSTQCAMWDAS